MMIPKCIKGDEELGKSQKKLQGFCAGFAPPASQITWEEPGSRSCILEEIPTNWLLEYIKNSRIATE